MSRGYAVQEDTEPEQGRVYLREVCTTLLCGLFGLN